MKMQRTIRKLPEFAEVRSPFSCLSSLDLTYLNIDMISNLRENNGFFRAWTTKLKAKLYFEAKFWIRICFTA
jgi:hypothetical protein